MQFSGKLAKQRKINAQQKARRMATIADCYQWPEGRNGGCWGRTGAAVTCFGAVRRSARRRRAMTEPGNGRRKRRKSADLLGGREDDRRDRRTF